MHDYLVQQGLGDRLTLTDTPAEALRQLAAGKTDYAVVDIVPGMYIIRELKLTNLLPAVRNVASHRYCYAVDKGNDELLSRINEGLAILKKTGKGDIFMRRGIFTKLLHNSAWVAGILYNKFFCIAGGTYDATASHR